MLKRAFGNLLLVGLVGTIALTGLAPITAASEGDYDIRFGRPSKIGDKSYVRGAFSSKTDFTFQSGGQAGRVVEEKRVDLSGIVTVQEVDQGGDVIKLSLLVESCTIDTRTDGISETKDLLQPGTYLAARTVNDKTVFTEKNRELPEVQQGYLRRIVATSTFDGPDAVDADSILGTNQRRKIGESWKVNGEAAGKYFSEFIKSPTVAGTAKFEAVEKHAGEECAKVTLAMAIKGRIKLEDLENIGAEAAVQASYLIPIDLSVMPLKSTMKTTVRARAVNGVVETKGVVTERTDTEVRMLKGFSRLPAEKEVDDELLTEPTDTDVEIPARRSESPTEMDLYQELLTGPDRVAALETVLKTPDKYSAAILFLAAGVAFGAERLEDSAFLLYAGQLRMRFDQKCFPPKGTGGNDPFLAVVLVSQGLGSGINPAIMAEPKAYKRAIDRLKKWSPKAPEEYTPGYEFKARLSEKDAHEAARPNREEFLSRMGDMATLLNDAEYFAAYTVVRNYNPDRDDKVPARKEESEKAKEKMKRIEKRKGLSGFAAVIDE